MRIVAGALGGRIFAAPPGHRTHPMGDKVRGALFNVLGDVEGLTVLDAFAGSGALGFEAVSRGARSALLVEVDKNAHQTIDSNIKQLGVGPRVKLVRANVSSWSDNNEQLQYDLVLCDPPYDSLRLILLQKLVRHVRPGGTYVLSWPSAEEPPELIGLERLADKEYAGARLLFYRKS